MQVQAKFLQSSNIEAAGYARGKLFVKFKSGQVYSYDKVPFTTYREMVEAESVGHYFHLHVRNTFKFERLAEDPFFYPVVKH